jgi:hypothetical protein
MTRYILSHDNVPMECPDRAQWARWIMNTERRVALDEIGEVTVSTWFRAFDYVVVTPMLWETAIIGGPLHGTIERYATRDESLIGHARIVEVVKALPQRKAS